MLKKFGRYIKGTFWCLKISNWAVPWENQHNAFATSTDPDQPAHLRSLIRIHDVHLQILLQVEKLIANSMDPDQTARRRRLVKIHVGCKCTMLVLSWRGSIVFFIYEHLLSLPDIHRKDVDSSTGMNFRHPTIL
jgi:hypothetical protein